MASRTLSLQARRPYLAGTGVFAPVVVMLLSVVALYALQWLALRTSRGQLVDQRVTGAAKRAPWVDLTPAARALGNVSLDTAVVGCVVLIGFALLHRGWLCALAAGAVVGGSNLTTQALKHVLLQRTEDAVISGNSLPSGHVTVVASLVLAALLVSRPLLRPVLAVVGALWIALIGTATILAGWYRLSDAVAAMLVALAWASGVAAVFAFRGSTAFAAGKRTHLGWILGVTASAVAAVGAAAWMLSRPDALGDYQVMAGIVAVGVTSACAAVSVGAWWRLLAATGI